MRLLGFVGVTAVIATGCGSLLPTEDDDSGTQSAGAGRLVLSAQAGLGSCSGCPNLPDGTLSYQTPSGLRIGVRSVELLRSADDSSPVSLPVPDSLGEVDLVAGATISDVDITALPEGDYTHARLALDYVVFEVDATGHLAGLISAEGVLIADYALSDYDDDELGPRVQGDYAASFSSLGVSISQSGWEAVEYPTPHPGGSVDTADGVYRVTFPTPGGPISIAHDVSENVSVTLTFFVEDAFGWRDIDAAGFLDDVMDLAADAVSTEMPESMIIRGFSMDVAVEPSDAQSNPCGVSSCPGGSINCMPVVPPDRQQLCSVECGTWMSAHCPNVDHTF